MKIREWMSKVTKHSGKLAESGLKIDTYRIQVYQSFQ